MSKVRRVDFYPDEYIAGTSGQLSMADQGMYWLICTLVYSRGGPIDDDHMWLSRMFSGAHWRQVRGSIDRLCKMGKVYRTGTAERPQIMVKRCAEELQKTGTRISKAVQNGLRGGRPPKEINDMDKPDGFPDEKLTTNYQPPTTNQEDKGTVVPSSSGDDAHAIQPAPKRQKVRKKQLPDPDIGEAFDRWNVMAERTGLPVAQKMTPRRESSIRARLKECGGLDGWDAALAKVEASSFCNGSKTDFRADLDFLLQARSFSRLMEGSYDDPGAGARASPSRASPAMNALRNFMPSGGG